MMNRRAMLCGAASALIVPTLPAAALVGAEPIGTLLYLGQHFDSKKAGWVRCQQRDIRGKVLWTTDFIPGEYDTEKMLESDARSEAAFKRASLRLSEYPQRSEIMGLRTDERG